MPNMESGEAREEVVVGGGWNLTMDAQVMAWATQQPEVWDVFVYKFFKLIIVAFIILVLDSDSDLFTTDI